MSAENDLVNPREVIGSNHPPDTLNSVLASEAVDKEVAAADKWAATVSEIANADQADRAKDAIDRLNALWKKYEAERKIEKKPHDDAAAAVQKRWFPILYKIDLSLRAINALHKSWLRREDERLAQERRAKQDAAEKAAREAEEALCKAEQAKQAPVSARLAAEAAVERAKQAEAEAAAVPDRARTSGSYGRPARSLRTVWYGVVIDVLKAARHYREHPDLVEVLTKLVSADARGGLRDQPGRPAVPGCEIKSRKE